MWQFPSTFHCLQSFVCRSTNRESSAFVRTSTVSLSFSFPSLAPTISSAPNMFSHILLMQQTSVRILKCCQDLPASIRKSDMLSLTELMVNNRQRFCRLWASCPQVGSEIQGFDNQGMALECAQSDHNTFHLTCKSHIVCHWKF